MAPHTGFDKVQQNVGKVQNAGLEITLNSVNITSDKFRWTSSFNISFNKKVVSKKVCLISQSIRSIFLLYVV